MVNFLANFVTSSHKKSSVCKTLRAVDGVFERVLDRRIFKSHSKGQHSLLLFFSLSGCDRVSGFRCGVAKHDTDSSTLNSFQHGVRVNLKIIFSGLCEKQVFRAAISADVCN